MQDHQAIPESNQALKDIWKLTGLPVASLDSVKLTGQDPILPSSFAVGTAAQTCIAATGLAAAAIWQLCSGKKQNVAVDMLHAAIEFRSERYLKVDGVAPPDPWDKIAGLYRCKDGWVRIHTNFPHHRDGILAILGCAYDKASVQEALMQWSAEHFETETAEHGMCATALRSFEQWDQLSQAKAVVQLPLFTLEKIGDAPAQALPYHDRPLGGVRVLDLTRVIAGPVAGRTLAAHGADVMLVSSPNLPFIPSLVIDTGRGKHSCYLDLCTEASRDQLHHLIQDADVFLQGYRPGGLENLGFGVQDLAREKPGIIYASLSAYGHLGPWSERHGFDSLVQTATGFNDAEAKASGDPTPKVLPAQVLDHASGYLLALGIMAALYRRATEGGTWQVRVSLAQTAQWLRQLGRLNQGFACTDFDAATVTPFLEQAASGFGELTGVKHAAQLNLTPTHWDSPSVPLGTHAAAWW